MLKGFVKGGRKAARSEQYWGWDSKHWAENQPLITLLTLMLIWGTINLSVAVFPNQREIIFNIKIFRPNYCFTHFQISLKIVYWYFTLRLHKTILYNIPETLIKTSESQCWWLNINGATEELFFLVKTQEVCSNQKLHSTYWTSPVDRGRGFTSTF